MGGKHGKDGTYLEIIGNVTDCWLVVYGTTAA